MTEFRFTDDEWRKYQQIPDQGYSHRHHLEHVVNQRLRAHDAEVAANALRDAAAEIEPWNVDRPHDWTEVAAAEAGCAVRVRDRADRIEREAGSNPEPSISGEADR